MKRALSVRTAGLFGTKGFEHKMWSVPRSHKDAFEEPTERSGDGAATGAKVARGVALQRRMGFSASGRCNGLTTFWFWQHYKKLWNC